MNLNLTAEIKMPDHKLRRQVIDLCNKVGKPLLKLSTKDYVDNGLGHLVEQFQGQAGLVNIEVFNELQHTITGWPGGKPNADDSTRPERALPYPKRVVVFSPHPDDDVISMGGTIRRLMQQGLRCCWLPVPHNLRAGLQAGRPLSKLTKISFS
jgi:glucosamine-6-phosphate deaminase